MLINGGRLFKSNQFNTWKVTCLSTNAKSKVKKQNPFTQTVFLPQTHFPSFEQETIYEKSILDSGLIDQLYLTQNSRKNVNNFNFLDGPPYSNGDLHVGHAINKTLKDIFCRYYVNRGFKVDFRPGWDCHGLPIELKAIKNQSQLDSISIRERSKNFALNTLKNQLNGFKRYGVMANFTEPYITCTDDYVTNQINAFFELYRKDLIEKKFYPIYWSPSSKSALAEAELEYNNQHSGYSLYFKFRINKETLEEKLQTKFEKPLNAIIWTTTPWTIPSNMAISYSKKLDYAIVKSNDEFFLINSKSIDALEKELERNLTFVQSFKGECLENLTYEHPSKLHSRQPFIDCDFVDESKGTGLVHNSPNHGHEDYLLFTSRNLDFEDSLVDENGCFNDRITKYLSNEAVGLNIFKEGSDFVIKHLKANVLKSSEYIHSYPYDWRTKQPVFTTVKNQFFMNIKTIKEQCLDAIDQVNFIPPVFTTALKTNINKRTEWCISRQRCWGVPIPAFYAKEDQEHLRPIIKENLIKQINRLILEQGANCWWKNSIDDFLPDHVLSKEKLSGTSRDYSKETDILDVWFDSGIAWNYVLNQTNKQADLVLEGQDQLRGWFLSSLILSVGLQGIAPFKNVFVHGFALDKDSKKMSKSLGNVVDPIEIVDGRLKYGADVFRIWVSKYANSHANIATKMENFELCKENLQKWRKIFRFSIANLNDFTLANQVTYEKMNNFDRLILHKLYNYNELMERSYEEFNLDAIYQETNDLLSWISSSYFASIKSKLYNEELDHESRRSIQCTLYYLIKVFEQNLSPIVPFFFINFKKYHPIKEENKELIDYFNCPNEWKNEELNQDFEFVHQIQDCLNKFQINETISPQFKLILFPKNEETKRRMQRIKMKLGDELNDILLVQSVEFNWNDEFKSKFDVNKLERLEQSTGDQTNESDENDEAMKMQLKAKLVNKLKDKNDRVSKYVDEENYDLVLERTECKRCLRCRLYVCDPDQVKSICLKCKDFLVKNHPKLVF